MKKQNAMKILRQYTALLLSLTLFLCLLAGCTEPGPDTPATSAPTGDTTQGTGDVPTPAEPFAGTLYEIVKDGIGAYAIIVDTDNDMEKTFATDLQQTIKRLSGVTVPVRNLRNLETYEKRILIGNTGDDLSEQAKTLAGENDFAICSSSNTVALYATDISNYELLEMFLNVYCLRTQGKDLSMNLPASFSLSASGMTEGFGAIEELILGNDDVNYQMTYAPGCDSARRVGQKLSVYFKELGLNTVLYGGEADASEQTVIRLVLVSENSNADWSLKADCAVSGRYAVTVETDGTIVVGGFDAIDLLYAGFALAEMIKGGAVNNTFTMKQSDFYYSENVTNTLTIDKVVAARLYREAFGTYESYVAMHKALLGASDKADQTQVEALIDRMGDCFAVYPGSSSALYKGFITKLDTQDYSKKTYMDESGDIWIAAEFAHKYFGSDASFSEKDGMMNLTDFCEGNSAYTFYYNPNHKVATVCPEGMDPFTAENMYYTVNGYTNSIYMNRMAQFFNSRLIPEPSNNTEQSRVVISELIFNPSEVYDYTKYPYMTHYSPGICATTENGKTVLYVSYEDCYVTNFATEHDNRTFLVRSTDDGKTWEQLGLCEGMRWASIYELNGKIYVMGTHFETNMAILAEYNPTTDTFRSANLSIRGGGAAPTAATVANGRFYKACGSTVMSVPVDADMFDPQSWTVASNYAGDVADQDWFKNQIGYTEELENYALGEGNLVTGKDGTVYYFLRVDCQPLYGYAVILEVSVDGRTLSLPEGRSALIRLPDDEKYPSSTSKFSIRYDEKSGKYYSLVSLATMKNPNQRNALALIASDDLFNWYYIDTVLVDREMMNPTLSRFAHGYQYVDFVIAGDDIHMVVREATGATNTYHDGKYVSYYVMKDFRNL